MVTDLVLAAEYKPTALYFHDADCVEYLRADVPSINKRVDELLTLVLRMDTREPIGFKIKGFRNIYLNSVKPIQEKLDDARFILLVSVFERLAEKMGERIFGDRETQQAYKTAAEIAREDRVELHDLPEAA